MEMTSGAGAGANADAWGWAQGKVGGGAALKIKHATSRMAIFFTVLIQSNTLVYVSQFRSWKPPMN